MNIFKKMMSFFTSPTTGVWQNNIDGFSQSQSGEVISEHAVLNISAAWACINLISNTISNLPLSIYEKDSQGTPIEKKDHSLYNLLRYSPNFEQTAFDFWVCLNMALELRGNAYAQIVRNPKGEVIGLFAIPPNCMSVKRDENYNIVYTWIENNKQRIGTAKDIFHIRGFGGNPLGGLSTLSHAKNTFGNAISADKLAGDMFRNGLRPSGTVSVNEWLTNEQREIANNKILSKVGVGNNGKPFLLEGGMKWESLSLTPEDAQMLQSRSFSVQEVCRIFGVPPHMVGHTEKSTSWGTGIEQQNLGFLNYTLGARLTRIEQSIRQSLLTPEDRAKGVYVAYNPEKLLRTDSKGRSEFYKNMTAIGAMTINEVRMLERLPRVDGGDVPRVQMQNVPITQANAEAEEDK